ncbi:MAG TPA: glycerol-3-phosphate responsive antiterminator [Bryocella sp.]|nr:glycerol-3-phosphate responsive antiterminator [Bryocella sp.]
MATYVEPGPARPGRAKDLAPAHPTDSYRRAVRATSNAQQLTRLLKQTRIIPAVRDAKFLERSTTSPGKIVYFLFGNPEDIGTMAEMVVAAGKIPIVNVDLAAGLSRDQAAISYLAHRQVLGIISTHPEPLRAARDFGLFAIKRTFLLDSAALESALRSLDQFEPDALEVLPAMAAPHIVTRLHQAYPDLPVIAGGLVKTMREIEELVQQGVHAVSASDYRLWIA